MTLESRHVREARFDALAEHYRRNPPSTTDRLAELETAFARLRQDLHDADNDLDSYARHDWPSAPSARLLITQELTLGDQLMVLQTLAEFLLTRCACTAAAPLVDRVRALLAPPAFVAPTRTVCPPWPIHLAIQRLKAAGLLPINPERLPIDDEPLSRDQRLLAFWLAQLETD